MWEHGFPLHRCKWIAVGVMWINNILNTSLWAYRQNRMINYFGLSIKVKELE